MFHSINSKHSKYSIVSFLIIAFVIAVSAAVFGSAATSNDNHDKFDGVARIQSVLFDFDTAPLHSSFPLNLTSGGITAHFSVPPGSYNYSIQQANVLGFTPAGFAGYCVYPNQVFACDLWISFDQPLTDISIMYAPNELATDSSCTMRITGYMGSAFVGTNTYINPNAGTWPTGILSLSSAQPFDNVVIHYEAPPATGGDYGPIFMADNLTVTTAAGSTPTATDTPTDTPTAGPTGTPTDTPLVTPTSTPGGGMIVTDLNHGVTPEGLANLLVGNAVTISNVTYTGGLRASGTFSGGQSIVGFDSGIILGSGSVQTVSGDVPCSVGVEGPNTCHELGDPNFYSNSTDFGLPGDADLTGLSGNPTYDATVLEFDFVPQYSSVQFKYVFSSDEYSDYSNTQFNDVFAFYINGVNGAVVPGTGEPVSINTINNGNDAGGDTTPHNPQFFIDNVQPTVTINTEMDGLTTILTCSGTVIPGQPNHMKLAIADASDGIFDTAVFLKAVSLISGTVIDTSLTGGGQTGPFITVPQGTSVTDSAELEGSDIGSAGGTLTYTVFSDHDCTQFFANAGTKTVTNGLVPNSDPIMFDLAGTYYWQASYSGDASHNAASSSCDDERVIVTIGPTPTVTSSPLNTSTNTATPTSTLTATPTSTATITPAITPTPPPVITGAITYGNAAAPPKFVSNVLIDGAGLPNVTTTTSFPDGTYSLTGFGSGSYTVTPTKTGGVNGISSFDAAKIAQHVAGIVSLTGNQLVVADVSNNGSISSFDAGEIANYVVTSLPAGIAGTWKFFPGSMTYSSITTDITGQDYSALLMGEVSGNWTNTGARPENSRQKAVASNQEQSERVSSPHVSKGSMQADDTWQTESIQVTLPQLVNRTGKDISVPVIVDGAANKGIIAYEFDLRYDPTVIQPQKNPVDVAGTVSRGLIAVANAKEPGLLRVAVYGPMPIVGNGVLLNLKFTTVGIPGSVSPLIWDRLLFNEGEPQVVTTDGLIASSP